MKRTALFAAILLASTVPVFAQTASEPTVRVGGQAMFPSKTIVGNAVNSAEIGRASCRERVSYTV